MEELTPQQKSDFLNRIKNQTEEKLISIYLQKDGYQPAFIDLVIEELKNRGFNPSELSSFEVAQNILVKKKTDEELIEIYTNPDDNENELVNLAEMEIENRNLPIHSINEEKAENEKSFKEGKQGDWITAGYVFSVLGGFIGLAIGCQYVFSTNKNVNGERFYKYNESTRKHGKRMLMLFAVMSVLYLMIMFAD